MLDHRYLVYITAFIPYGKTESFVLEEIVSVRSFYKDILVIPRNPPSTMFHKKARELEGCAIRLPLLNFAIVSNFMCSLFSLSTWRVVECLLKKSTGVAMKLKNLIVLPKSIYLARQLKKMNVKHIHAHWA